MNERPWWRKCESCKYFQKVLGDYKGSCHRFPPQFSVAGGLLGDTSYTRFPRVDTMDWCGEWIPVKEIEDLRWDVKKEFMGDPHKLNWNGDDEMEEAVRRWEMKQYDE